MKNILLDIINNDKSYNKSATRYLHKTHPDLWNKILESTNFLPKSAKPKQRVWHVLNEVWKIPLCPEKGVEVKWHENRYLTYSSFLASRNDVAKKVSTSTKGKNHWRKKDSTKSEKANEKFKDNLKLGYHKPFNERDRDPTAYAEKAKQTCLKKYGLVNGSQTKKSRNKISDARIRNGASPKEHRTLQRLYNDAVWKFTEENWKKHFDKINPSCIPRSRDNVLDHIYSRQKGFLEGIPPYIIGHYTNLRIISLSENSSKGMRCDKSKDSLFEDFFA